ncbi:MAG: phosphoserine phosphatase SerB [Bosea sp. (in: a-proteobacteria)]
MRLSVTLVSSPKTAALTDARLRAAVQALRTMTGAEPESRMLKPQVAADMLVEAQDSSGLEAALREALANAPVDIIIQPAATRAKQLFLADMDSTMIAQECIDELADYVGLKTEVSEITERAMRGELPFEPALRERVALLKGLPVKVVEEIIASRITLTPGGPELLRTLRANGAYTALVSGGFTIFTGPISAMIGFHEHRSNILEMTPAGELAGMVREPILGKQAKLDTLAELRGARGLAAHATMAVGDGANDLAMLGEAGLGVAFHAKPAVAAAAHARIDHADLTALIYCQGYSEADIPAA